MDTSARRSEAGRSFEVPRTRGTRFSYGKVFGATAQGGSLALLDQAIVSGANFLTGVLIGRALGAAELGIYALGTTIVMFVVLVQDALIGVPYTVFGNRVEGTERTEYAGASLSHAGILALIAMACLTVGLVTARVFGIGSPDIWMALGVVVVAIPFLQIRELARRMSFAHMRVGTVLRVDIVVAVLQIGGVLVLMQLGRLSAAAALGAMGLGAAVAGLIWLWESRSGFRFERSSVKREVVRHWRFGRWDLGAQVTNWLNQFGLYWLVVMLVDTNATGVFAACLGVVSLSNPLVLGIGNVVGPKTARAFAGHGTTELTRVVRKTTLLLGVAMAVFCGVIIAVGGEILTQLYGPEFAGYGLVAATLALAQCAWALGISSGHALRALERPDAPFHASAASLGTTFAVATVLLPVFGILGVAIALLVGRIVELALREMFFRRFIIRAH